MDAELLTQSEYSIYLIPQIKMKLKKVSLVMGQVLLDNQIPDLHGKLKHMELLKYSRRFFEWIKSCVTCSMSDHHVLYYLYILAGTFVSFQSLYIMNPVPTVGYKTAPMFA